MPKGPALVCITVSYANGIRVFSLLPQLFVSFYDISPVKITHYLFAQQLQPKLLLVVLCFFFFFFLSFFPPSNSCDHAIELSRTYFSITY